ncbi:MAG: KOW domain-containing RNA-binding protein [Clostridia bacterium]|jgi:RNase P/RNase MRP subunit p29|nr:KOW domain-containing RNA-binding protein [Clostridia bacterium]
MSGNVGCLARSLAGRDAGIICLILREEDENVFIADGRDRRVETPKKKNRKHVRLITGENGEPIRFSGEALTNRFLRNWLREQAGRVQV